MSFTKSRASASLVTKKGNRKSHLFSFLSLLDVSFRQFFISVLVSEFHKCDNCLEATKLLSSQIIYMRLKATLISAEKQPNSSIKSVQPDPCGVTSYFLVYFPRLLEKAAQFLHLFAVYFIEERSLVFSPFKKTTLEQSLRVLNKQPFHD